MSYPANLEYSIQDMINLRDELADTDLSIKDELTPANWKDGNMAISSTYFYMFYVDHDFGGVNIKTIAKSDRKIKVEKGFLDMAAAHEWIIKHHNDNQDDTNE